MKKQQLCLLIQEEVYTEPKQKKNNTFIKTEELYTSIYHPEWVLCEMNKHMNMYRKDQWET